MFSSLDPNKVDVDSFYMFCFINLEMSIDFFLLVLY